MNRPKEVRFEGLQLKNLITQHVLDIAILKELPVGFL